MWLTWTRTGASAILSRMHTIRDVRRTDFEFIVRLGQLEFNRYGGDGGARCLLGLTNPESIALICEDDSVRQPLGFAIVVFWEGSPYLHAIAIREESRRAGVGRTLIRECCIRASSKFGRSDLVLHVAETNIAGRAFFKSLGFNETPEPRGYPRRWSSVSDIAVRMARVLAFENCCQ